MDATTTQDQRAPAPVALQPVVRHDFTREKCRWGWNVIYVWPRVEDHWTAMFIGLGIKDGDELLLTTQNGTVAVFRASQVLYDTNPRDLMTCHLTVVPND